VHEFGRFELARYSKNGQFLSTVRLPVRIPASTFFDALNARLYMVTAGFGGSDHPTERKVEYVPLDGSVPGVFLTEDELPPNPKDRQPRAADWALAVSPSGEIVVGNRHTYAIWVYNEEGQLVQEFNHTVSQQERDNIGHDTPSSYTDRNRRGRDVVPYFGRFAMRWDDRGRLWILRDRGDARVTTFELFGPDWDFLGSVQIDAEVLRGIQGFDVRSDELAIIVLDETGNTLVEVWGLTD
jgi:hypothetical protein